MSRSFAALKVLLPVAALLAAPAVHAVIATHEPPDATQTQGKEVISVDAQEVTASSRTLLNPYSRVWNSVDSATLPLYAQRVAEPYGGGNVSQVQIQVARTEIGIAVRLSWLDSSKDDASNQSQFKDGAAVEFPVDSRGSSLAMGHSGRPVNIWHWMADMESASTSRLKHGRVDLESPDQAKVETIQNSPVEDLLAAGSYNRARKEQQLVRGHGEWRDGQWAVVFYKPLDVADSDAPSFDSGQPLPTAVAIWNGSAGDRLGMKSVSNWATINIK